MKRHGAPLCPTPTSPLDAAVLTLARLLARQTVLEAACASQTQEELSQHETQPQDQPQS
jgi:hypothetical protein